ncbi:hypothetical protein ACLKA6_008538 [Drosophila palustris]
MTHYAQRTSHRLQKRPSQPSTHRLRHTHHHTGYGIHNIITPAAKAAIPAINTPALTYTHHTGYGIHNAHHTGCKSGHSSHQHTGFDVHSPYWLRHTQRTSHRLQKRPFQPSTHRLQHTHHHTGYGIYNIITPAAKAAIPAINTPALTYTHHTGYGIHNAHHTGCKRPSQPSTHRLQHTLHHHTG